MKENYGNVGCWNVPGATGTTAPIIETKKEMAVVFYMIWVYMRSREQGWEPIWNPSLLFRHKLPNSQDRRL
jgi:hypothetical protein